MPPTQEWPGILQGTVLPSNDAMTGLSQSPLTHMSGVVILFSRDLSQGLIQMEDGSTRHFSPEAFWSPTTKVPAANDLVRVYLDEKGHVVTVAARPREDLTATTPTWYDLIMADEEDKIAVTDTRSTTEWFQSLTRTKRKEILAVLHDVRREASDTRGTKAALISELLKHLDLDHGRANPAR